MEEAQRFNLASSAISLGVSLSDNEVDRAARQMVQTGLKVGTLEVCSLRCHCYSPLLSTAACKPKRLPIAWSSSLA